MPRSDTSPTNGRTGNTSPANPYRARRIVGFVMGAAGFAAAVAGGWSWALAIVLWIVAVLLIAVTPSPEERVARDLGAIHDIDKMKAGEWACQVQWDGSDFAVFDSMEAAKTMAQRLVQINEPSASAEASTLPSVSVHCYEAFIWPNIGPIPVRAWVWNPEAGDWAEAWSGSASAAGAAAAIRKAAREQQARAAAEAAAASTTPRPSSWP